VGLMLILSLKDMEIVSWGLLFLPLVVLTICYFFARSTNTKDSTSTSMTVPAVSCSVSAKGKPSTIGTPSSPTMSAAVASAPYSFTPITSCANST
jgi:cytoskeletal protein RodZ